MESDIQLFKNKFVLVVPTQFKPHFQTVSCVLPNKLIIKSMCYEVGGASVELLSTTAQILSSNFLTSTLHSYMIFPSNLPSTSPLEVHFRQFPQTIICSNLFMRQCSRNVSLDLSANFRTNSKIRIPISEVVYQNIQITLFPKYGKDFKTKIIN